jgi:GTPase
MGYEKGFLSGLWGDLFGLKADDGDRALEDAKRKLEADGADKASGGAGTFMVEDVYKIVGVGVIPAGKVASGTIRVGDRCEHMSGTYTVKTMEMHHEQVKVAVQGDAVGMALEGLTDKNLLKRGDVLEFHG